MEDGEAATCPECGETIHFPAPYALELFEERGMCNSCMQRMEHGDAWFGSDAGGGYKKVICPECFREYYPNDANAHPIYEHGMCEDCCRRETGRQEFYWSDFDNAGDGY